MVKLKKSTKKNNNYTLIQLYVGEGCGIHEGVGCNNRCH